MYASDTVDVWYWQKKPRGCGVLQLKEFTLLTIVIIVWVAPYAITSGRGKADYCEEQGDDQILLFHVSDFKSGLNGCRSIGVGKGPDVY
jgi:hypothetical protein